MAISFFSLCLHMRVTFAKYFKSSARWNNDDAASDCKKSNEK